jgi:hypothetical protein
MQAVQPCRLLSQGYNYEENPALDLYSIYQSRFATPCVNVLLSLSKIILPLSTYDFLSF